MLNFINIETHPTLKGFLGGLLNESQIFNLYANFFNNYDRARMPDRFTILKYHGPSFLDITGHIITPWLAGMILFGITQLTLL